MTLQIILEPGEDNWIVAECPALPGCVSQGRTETFGLLPTSVLVKNGRRLRLSPAGHDRETFARIPSDEVARISVTSSRQRASFLELPREQDRGKPRTGAFL